MFKCSFVLPRLYFCVLSLVLLLCSYSAFVSTCLLLLYMCIVLLYKINIVYIAFVQNPCWLSMQSCSMVSFLSLDGNTSQYLFHIWFMQGLLIRSLGGAIGPPKEGKLQPETMKRGRCSTTNFKCVINFYMFVYVTRHAYLICVCPTFRIALQIVISKVKLEPQPVLPTLCLHPSTTL